MISDLPVLVLSFGVFFTAFLSVVFLIPQIIKLSYRYNVLDKPNQRKSHESPTPLLGGVALFLSSWVSIIIFIPMNSLLGVFFGAV